MSVLLQVLETNLRAAFQDYNGCTPLALLYNRQRHHLVAVVSLFGKNRRNSSGVNYECESDAFTAGRVSQMVGTYDVAVISASNMEEQRWWQWTFAAATATIFNSTCCGRYGKRLSTVVGKVDFAPSSQGR